MPKCRKNIAMFLSWTKHRGLIQTEKMTACVGIHLRCCIKTQYKGYQNIQK